MSKIDKILQLIGLSVVALFALVAIAGMLLFINGLIIGNTNSLQIGTQGQDNVDKALSEYQYKLDLVKEQTQRLDMYYAAKAATSMSQVEYRSWLGQIKSLTEELIYRENNATDAGRMYLSFLRSNNDEYDRVIQNYEVSKNDVQMAKETYNGNVEIYNKQYGTVNGTIPYLL